LPATTLRGSVQQGLSVAGGALDFFQLGLATDKRYSLGRMTRYIHPVTPAATDGSVLSLVREVVPDSSAMYVDVDPIAGAAANDCFSIVSSQVQAHGGLAITGWSIWELPLVFVEAEFHAIWQSPDGRLLDVSPKTWTTTRILFVADPNREYLGRQVSNVRRPVSQAPCVAAFFATFDEEFKILNAGARADHHGAIALSGAEAASMNDIYERRHALNIEVSSLQPMPGPYLPCLCGCGKKAKWCLSKNAD
jgi:hypothetical protein